MKVRITHIYMLFWALALGAAGLVDSGHPAWAVAVGAVAVGVAAAGTFWVARRLRTKEDQ